MSYCQINALRYGTCTDPTPPVPCTVDCCGWFVSTKTLGLAQTIECKCGAKTYKVKHAPGHGLMCLDCYIEYREGGE